MNADAMHEFGHLVALMLKPVCYLPREDFKKNSFHYSGTFLLFTFFFKLWRHHIFSAGERGRFGRSTFRKL